MNPDATMQGPDRLEQENTRSPACYEIPLFNDFLVKSRHLLKAHAEERPSVILEDFRSFIESARSLGEVEDEEEPIDLFQTFITRAQPLVVAPLVDFLPTLKRVAELADAWYNPHDLLARGGFSFAEDPYTELLAWALAPETHPPTARTRQKAWLGLLQPPTDEWEIAIPHTQVSTDDGVPDLVMNFTSFTLVVEAKTGSKEHTTPLGGYQSESYESSIRRRFCLPNEVPVVIGYLSPDGHAPHNPKAIPITFFDVVFVLMDVLDEADLPVETRHAFSMLFTHILDHAVTPGQNLRALLQRISSLILVPDAGNAEIYSFIIGEFVALQRLVLLLNRRKP